MYLFALFFFLLFCCFCCCYLLRVFVHGPIMMSYLACLAWTFLLVTVCVGENGTYKSYMLPTFLRHERWASIRDRIHFKPLELAPRMCQNRSWDCEFVQRKSVVDAAVEAGLGHSIFSYMLMPTRF